MALIVHPYLGSAAARRELQMTTIAEPIRARRLPADPFKDLPIRLTYRTALVLSSIAQAPGASSKQVADASGITDAGQISRLLTRLKRNDLIQDTGIGPTKGHARAWTLTQRGEHILQATTQT
jgi:DNA-binding MarR family transcriptional regulator